jgi:hypothetical protein
MPTPSDIAPQSADPDGLHVVVDDAGGVAWRICSRGTCIEDRCSARLMSRYQDLLISQGMPAPIS